jgi:LAS superfamily LD-carboxypeptidase LdcB
MPKITKGSGHISIPPPPQTATTTTTTTSTNTGAARKIRAIEGKNYTNGEVPENLLRPINNMAKYIGDIDSDKIKATDPKGRIRLYEKASIALDNLIAAAEQAKIPVKINSGYRTYEDQVRVWGTNCSNAIGSGRCIARPKQGPAAVPGTSNHGFGLAVDFATPGLKKIEPGDKLYEWLYTKGNGIKFGFDRIASESWHWEYKQT